MAKPSRITVYLSESDRKKLEKSAKAKKHSTSQEARILLLTQLEKELEND